MKTNHAAEVKKAVSLKEYIGNSIRLEKRGNEWWGCCPFHKESTPSFAIKTKTDGEVFFCQGCGKGGDIIKYVELTEGLPFKKALEKLMVNAGMAAAKEVAALDDNPNADFKQAAKQVTDTFQEVESKKKITRPVSVWPKHEKALADCPEAIAYLLDQRGITQETAERLRFGFCQSVEGRLNPEDDYARALGWIMFPRIMGDLLVACKMRSISTKAFSQIAGMDPKALFNSETVNAVDDLFVTEGEFDTAIMEQAGYAAVSIPNASTKLTPEMRLVLKTAPRVYLAGDNDGKVGNAAMKQLALELGANTYMLLWEGCKDANECFLKICERDTDKFRAIVEEMKRKAHASPVEGFTNVIDRLRSMGVSDAGNDPRRLHYRIKEIDDMNYSPSGAVIVLYSTYSGTGKTVFATEWMTHEAKRGEVVVVYSPEVRDDAYMALLASQLVGKERMPVGLDRAGKITQEEFNTTADLLEKCYPAPEGPGTSETVRYYVGFSLPETETDAIIKFLERVIQVTGATRFVIDTLHRIVATNGRENQAEAEGRVVKAIEALGIKYGTIFVLIGQSNKEAEGLKEERGDSHGILRGSRELSDVAYAVYLLHRKRKPKGADGDDILLPETDVILKKDRGKGPGKSTVHLTFLKKCSTFELLANPGQDALAPVNDEGLKNHIDFSLAIGPGTVVDFQSEKYGK